MSEIQEFAMVISLPRERLGEWERILRHAQPPHGIHCQVRGPLLLMIQVEADLQFEAIERAEKWLRYLGHTALPPFEVQCNPQDSSMV